MKIHTKHWLATAALTAVLSLLFFYQIGLDFQSGKFQIRAPELAFGYMDSENELCSDLVAYWKLDEGTGSILSDISGYDQDAEIVDTDSISWSDDVPNNIEFWNENSLELDGISYIRSTGSVINQYDDLSISMWVNYATLNSADDSNVLISYGGIEEERIDNILYSLNIRGSDKKLRMMWENGTDSRDVISESTIAAPLTAGVWRHLVVTRDSFDKEVKFYSDGQMLGSVIPYTIVPSGGTGGTLSIGADKSDIQLTAFNGAIDDVRIYNKALTSDQVLALFTGNDDLGGCSCGNGEIEPPEECDDGNAENSDSCTNSCTTLRCGDGYVQSGNDETCEPPGTETCAFDCTTISGEEDDSDDGELTIPENCGNRKIEEDEGEECDEGHLNGTSFCSEYCTELYCGDDIISAEINEECEPTPITYVNGLPIFEEPTCGDTCSIPDYDQSAESYTGGCQRLFLQPCNIEIPEQSSSSAESVEDDSDDDAEEEEYEEGEGDDYISFCGDSIVQPFGADGIEGTDDDESCDNGSYCSDEDDVICRSDSNCIEGTTCDYDYDFDETCTNQCKLLLVHQPPISFPQEYSSSAASSQSSEVLEETSCGDFIKQGNEECDNGILNSDTDSDACRTDCTFPICGDSVIDSDEECDSGEQNSDTSPDSCRADCTIPYCGDLVRDSAEECDGEPGCQQDCTFVSIDVCGDGVLQINEQCDDGNILANDGCSPECKKQPILRTGISSSSSSSSSIEQVSSSVASSIISSMESSQETVSSVPIVEPVSSSSATSNYQVDEPNIFTLAPIANDLRPNTQVASVITHQVPRHRPVGDTGPAAVIVLAAGASSGLIWQRKKHKNLK